MGRAKQTMMENEENNDLVDFLKELLDREQLTGASEGIAKQIIDKGVDSMSEKQQLVIDKIVDDYKKNNQCDMCVDGNIGALTDYIYISENGLCPTCENIKEKSMKD